ncbi:hypothetical protein A7A08_03143 [Methyloligella halotolerans]|uniref:Uncharacterized protein n=1 Tax=Methyloligella halotolerans TaxID=1177755 RepID=A0A1E2RVC0_9HYPH|nr:hypothetical protein [Methyloligella halotolerans]ODA65999.1 hypothetical protein A7A08_03143 [Methyloligella halotolerans]
MAVGGSPEKAMPASARRTRKLSQFGAKAEAIIRKDDEKSEITITRFLPKTSDNALATSMETARNWVVKDRERLASAGLTPNSEEKTGRIG